MFTVRPKGPKTRQAESHLAIARVNLARARMVQDAQSDPDSYEKFETNYNSEFIIIRSGYASHNINNYPFI